MDKKIRQDLWVIKIKRYQISFYINPYFFVLNSYYEGHLPVLVTSDIDVLHEVFVNQFNNFVGRKILPFHVDDRTAGLFMATGDKWKRFRSIINPTFSPSKLKQVFVLKNIIKLMFFFFILFEK